MKKLYLQAAQETVPYSRWVTRQFRIQVCNYYPAACSRPDYAALFEQLLFHNEGLPTSYGYLARLTGQDAQAQSRNLNTTRFLDNFQQDTGLTLTVTAPDWRRGEAREVYPHFPPKLLRVVDAELSRVSSERVDLVRFVDGQPRTPRRVAADFKQRDRATYADPAQDRPNTPAMNYFAGQPTNAYSKYLSNLDDAVSAVQVSGRTPAQKRAVLGTLHNLRDGLKPLLKQLPGTERLFDTRQGLQGLPGEVRQVVLRGAVVADLQAAHLRFVAYSWPVPELREVFGSGGNVWAALAASAGLALSPEVKQTLKPAVYSLLYGASRKTIRETLRPLGSDAVRAFMASGLVRALLSARAAQVARIKATGGVETPFGFLRLAGRSVPGLLSAAAFEAEAFVIVGVYEVARKYPHWLRVLSHEHDGVTLELLNPRNARKVKRLLQDAVGERARYMGTRAELVFSGVGV